MGQRTLHVFLGHETVAHQVVERRHVGPALHAALEHLHGLVGVASQPKRRPCNEHGVVWTVHEGLAHRGDAFLSAEAHGLDGVLGSVVVFGDKLCGSVVGGAVVFCAARDPSSLNHLGEVGEGELVVGSQSGVGVQRSFGEIIAHDGAVHVPVLAAGLVALGAWHQHRRRGAPVVHAKPALPHQFAIFSAHNAVVFAVVGEESLTDEDRLYLVFAEKFENEFLDQGLTNRTIFETLNLGWDLLKVFPNPIRQLKRIDAEVIEKYHPEFRDKNADLDRIDA